MPRTGTILFGISQARNFSITGVTHPAQLEKALVSANRNSVDPAPQLEICHVRTASGTVMVVEVQPLLPGEKPALYRGKPYLRQADGNYVMNSNDLKVFALAALSEAGESNQTSRSYPARASRCLTSQRWKHTSHRYALADHGYQQLKIRTVSCRSPMCATRMEICA